MATWGASGDTRKVFVCLCVCARAHARTLKQHRSAQAQETAMRGSRPHRSHAMSGAPCMRACRVQTYAVTPAKTGYGEGGVRPFHQDYRHYK